MAGLPPLPLLWALVAVGVTSLCASATAVDTVTAGGGPEATGATQNSQPLHGHTLSLSVTRFLPASRQHEDTTASPDGVDRPGTSWTVLTESEALRVVAQQLGPQVRLGEVRYEYEWACALRGVAHEDKEHLRRLQRHCQEALGPALVLQPHHLQAGSHYTVSVRVRLLRAAAEAPIQTLRRSLQLSVRPSCPPLLEPVGRYSLSETAPLVIGAGQPFVQRVRLHASACDSSEAAGARDLVLTWSATCVSDASVLLQQSAFSVTFTPQRMQHLATWSLATWQVVRLPACDLWTLQLNVTRGTDAQLYDQVLLYLTVSAGLSASVSHAEEFTRAPHLQTEVADSAMRSAVSLRMHTQADNTALSSPVRPLAPDWNYQVGTPQLEMATSVATDATGDVFLAGVTQGDLVPGRAAGSNDGFLIKVSGSGDELWRYQVGTSSADEARGVATDAADNAFLAGTTNGALVSGQTNAGSDDAFLIKVSGSGEELWRRQVGTSSADAANAVATDAAGNAFLAGYTQGALVSGQANAGSNDAFLIQVSGSGDELWRYQVGTSSSDVITGVTTDAAGHVFLAGMTGGALVWGQTNAGGDDAFLFKMNSSGHVLWRYQVGTSSDDEARGVATDAAGNAFLAGTTKGALVSGQTNAGGRDAFLVKLSGSGEELWRYQVGTLQFDNAFSVATDAAGNAFLAGYTSGALMSYTQGAFLIQVSGNGQELWRYQASSGGSYVYGVATDAAGNAFLAGQTTGSLVSGHDGGYKGDAFLLRVSNVAPVISCTSFQEVPAAALPSTSTANVCAHVVRFHLSGVLSLPQLPRPMGLQVYGVATHAPSRALSVSQSLLVTLPMTPVNTSVSFNWTVFRSEANFSLINLVVAGVTVPLDPPVVVQAPVNPLWSDWNYQVGTSKNDVAQGVATDAAGHVFLAGYTNGALVSGQAAGGTDAFLIQVSGSGQELWRYQVGPSSDDRASGVATDAAGNAFLAGYTNGALVSGQAAGVTDAFLIQVSGSGQELWRYQVGTSSTDLASGVATDAVGNAFLAGYTYGALVSGQANAGSDDAFLIQVSGSGQELWRYQVGTPSNDLALGVATDAAGNAFLAGQTGGALVSGQANAGNADAFLIKVSGSGQELWRYQGGTSSDDLVSGVATDAAGNAFLAGYTYGALVFGQANAGGTDAFLIQVSGSGQELWHYQVGTSSNDLATGVATDAAGNAFLAGYTNGALVSGQANAGSYDAFLIQVSGSGQELWRYQVGTSSNDAANGVATDAAGNAFLAGYTGGALVSGQANAGSSDAFLLRVSNVAPVISCTSFQEVPAAALPSTSTANVVRFHLSGVLSLPQLPRPMGLQVYGVATHAPSRALSVSQSLLVTLPMTPVNTSVSFNWTVFRSEANFSLINLVVAGVTVPLDPPVVVQAPVNPLWPDWNYQVGTSKNDVAQGVATDAAGHVFLAGITQGLVSGHVNPSASPPFTYYDVFLIKVSGSGQELWRYQGGTSSDDRASGVATDAAGNAFLAGYTGGTDAFLIQVSGSGQELWRYQVGTSSNDRASGVATDAAGNAFLAGQTGGALVSGQANAGNADAFLIKVSGSGQELWRYQVGTSSSDEATAVATDAVGNAFLAGYTNGALVSGQANAGNQDAFLIQVSGSGHELWRYQVGTSSNDAANGVATDAAGNAFLAGCTGGELVSGQANAGSSDAFLLRVSNVTTVTTVTAQWFQATAQSATQIVVRSLVEVTLPRPVQLCLRVRAWHAGTQVYLSVCSRPQSTPVQFNVSGLQPHTQYDMWLWLAGKLDTSVISATTLRNNIQLSGVPLVARAVSLYSPLELSVPVTVQGPVATVVFQACSTWGFTPHCSLLGRPPAGHADLSFVEGQVMLPGLNLTRAAAETFNIGSHTVELFLTSSDDSTDFVPPLPWRFNVTIQVRGTVLLHQVPSVVVGSLLPPSVTVELFPAPPAGSLLTVHFRAPAGGTSWHTNFNASAAPSSVTVTHARPQDTLVLQLDAAHAETTSQVFYDVSRTSEDAALLALVDLAQTQIELAVHNGLVCRVQERGLAVMANTLYLYPGQSSAQIPQLTVGCTPSLVLPDTRDLTVSVEVQGRIGAVLAPGGNLRLRTAQRTLFSVQAAAFTAVPVPSLVPLTVKVILQTQNSANVPLSLYPVNPDGVALQVQLVAADGIVNVPGRVTEALQGLNWSTPQLEVTLSRSVNYNLTVFPMAQDGALLFDPPALSFTAVPSAVPRLRIRATAGTAPGTHDVTYRLEGPDRVGFALHHTQSTTRVQLYGVLSFEPPLTALYLNISTGVSLSLSGLPSAAAGQLRVDFSAAAAAVGLTMRPSQFNFSSTSSAQQRVEKLLYTSAVAPATALVLSPTLSGSAAHLYVQPQWTLTVHQSSPAAFPATCAPPINTFVASTVQTSQLHVPVAVARRGLVLVYGQHARGWRNCSGDLFVTYPSEGTRGGTVHNATCDVPAGVGTGYVVGVALAAQVDTPLLTCNGAFFHYEPPTLKRNSLRIGKPQADGQTALYGKSVTATDTVYMDGTGFGSDSALITITYGPVGRPGQFGCPLVQDAQPSSGTLGCIMNHGEGVGLVFRVTVDQQAVVGHDTYSYPNEPVILSLSTSGCSFNNARGCPTRGRQALLTVQGQFFSPVAKALQITVGGQACIVLNSTESSATCTLPAGSGSDQLVRLSRVFGTFLLSSQANVSDSSAVLSYAEPTIEQLSSASCQRESRDNLRQLVDCPRTNAAGQTLTVTGRHFGPQPSILVGGVPCLDARSVTVAAGDSATDWRNDRQHVQCTLPAGGSLKQAVLVLTPQGAFSPATDQALVSYQQCQAGYQQLTRVTDNGTTVFRCDLCSRYRFQLTPGQPVCDPCPADQYKSSPDTTRNRCTLCPAGAVCSQGLPAAAQAGHWLYSPNNATVQVLSCLQGFCLDARRCFADDDVMAATGLPAVSCCASGRRAAVDNPLCGHCLEGYSEWNGSCVPCSTVQWGLVSLLLLAGYALLVFLHSSTRRTTGAKLSALVFFLQTIASCTKSDPSFPTVLTALASLDLLGTAGGSSCVVPLDAMTHAVLPFVQLLVLYGVLLVAFMGNVVAWLVHHAWWRLQQHGHREDSFPSFKTTPFRRVALALLFFSFIPTFRATVLLSSCVRVGEVRLVQAFPTISCDSAAYHQARIATALLSSALVCGLVAFVLLVGRQRYMRYWRLLAELVPQPQPHDSSDSADSGPHSNRHRFVSNSRSSVSRMPLAEAELDDAAVLPQHSVSASPLERCALKKFVEARFGFLFLPFRGDDQITAGWTAVLLLRNICVVLVTALVEEWRTRFVLLAGVLLLFLMVQLWTRPYAKLLDNRLHTGLYTGLIVISVLNSTQWYSTTAVRVLSLVLYYGCVLAWAIVYFRNKLSSRDAHDTTKAKTEYGSWCATVQRLLCWYRGSRRFVPTAEDDGHDQLDLAWDEQDEVSRTSFGSLHMGDGAVRLSTLTQGLLASEAQSTASSASASAIDTHQWLKSS